MACLASAGCAGFIPDTPEETEEPTTVIEEPTVEFTGIPSIAELATLQCYYHNVAKYEQDTSKFKEFFFNMGYQRVWIEYDGIIDVGVDVSEIKVGTDHTAKTVSVSLPKAQILSVDIDEKSISEPISEKGWMTKDLTKEQLTELVYDARDKMLEEAEQDSKLLDSARNRAKSIIELYVKNLCKEFEVSYTIVWTE